MSYVLLLLKANECKCERENPERKQRRRYTADYHVYIVLMSGEVSRGGFVSPAAEETALDDFDNECRRFFLTHLRIEPSSDHIKTHKDEIHECLKLH